MPGPTWYAKDIFGGTLKVPAGEITAAMPLRWNSEPPTTGQVGGGPWIVSKHTKNLAAAIDFVKFATTSLAVKAKPGPLSPGYPSYGPAANVWLKNLNKDPYFAAPPGGGDEGGRSTRLEGLEHGHLSRTSPSGRTPSSRSSSRASR